MNEYGKYLVSGTRNYRGHDPGSVFTARLDPRAELRAIRRGDIRLLRRVIPRPGPHTFPDGWLADQTTTTRGAERRLTHMEGSK